ncbi:MAG: hypothetical protein RBT25_09160, partial [Lentisphaeria bacterium]|nr:hypothetical protein [Lentisphaeria bacterium]
HANAGVYASEELRAAYLESIMPELRSVESFVLMKTPQPEKAPLLKATGSLGENRGEAILLVNPTPQKVPADSLTMQPYEKRWLFKKIKP